MVRVARARARATCPTSTRDGLAHSSCLAAEEKEKKAMDVGKILSIGFVVLNFLVVGGGAYLAYSGTMGYSQSSISDVELNAEIEALRAELQTKPVVYSMETLIRT